MNKNQLKTVLKPLIKECIKEVIFEEGVLSSVIKEVVKGTAAQVVTEAPEPTFPRVDEARVNSQKAQLAERRQKLLDSIGADAFNGVNIFEDTTPTSAPAQPKAGSVDLGDSNDAGVDISDLFASSGRAWGALSKGMKK
tara:strand:+ start:410 stop:826 length:417 start_codon:yes stop_codon:yes gene_type:complete